MPSKQQVVSVPATSATHSVPIPPVDTPAKKSGLFGWLFPPDERKQFEKDASQSHNLRRFAAYGGLIVATILYGAGLCAIAVFLGIWPHTEKVTSDMWHIVVAVLIALFTVPTVLVIAILKVSAPTQDSELPATVYEALGKIVEKVVDKLVD